MSEAENVTCPHSPALTIASDETLLDPGSSVNLWGYLPTLIVGATGGGKSFELAGLAATIVKPGFRRSPEEVLKQELMSKALCLTPTNTTAVSLRTKMERALSILPDVEQTPFVRPNADYYRCDTFHHAARRWIKVHGHHIGRPNVSEVCTEKRVELLLDALGEETQLRAYEPGRPLFDEAILELGNVKEVARRVREKVRSTLSIELPGEDFVEEAIMCAKKCKILNVTTSTLRGFIRSYKQAGYKISVDIFEEFGDNPMRMEAMTSLTGFYDEILQYNNICDFDDLIILGARLVEQHAEDIVEAEKVNIVVVDDLQNTNEMQRRIVRALVGKKGRFCRLVAACDSIDYAPCTKIQKPMVSTVFSFAGADPYATPEELMRQCLESSQAYNTFQIHGNARSTFLIQQLAYGVLGSEMVCQQPPADLHTTPVLARFRTVSDEAQYISEEIEKLQEMSLQETDALPSVGCMSLSTSKNDTDNSF
jgi:hypothetical protein